MKKHQFALMAMAFALNAAAAVSAQATEVMNIPWSAALQTSPSGADCVPIYPIGYTSTQVQCYLSFPLSIPVGHTILQIAVLHSTSEFIPNPYVAAELTEQTLAPWATETSKFQWSSYNVVPMGKVERSQLMAQFGKNYFDQFMIAPSTTYQVGVTLWNGATVSGIEVTYN